jgi:hypothetical protein
MAKKNITRTPEEQAAADAQELLHLRSQIKEWEAKVKEIENKLAAWYGETGDASIGGLVQVQERNNPVKLIGAEGKRKELLVERLIKELPAGYVKESKSLDLGRIYASLDSDPSVRALLNEAGLQVVQETSLVFKAI